MATTMQQRAKARGGVSRMASTNGAVDMKGKAGTMANSASGPKQSWEGDLFGNNKASWPDKKSPSADKQSAINNRKVTN